ncbi:hypothetical protein AB0I72_11915 [Nocardiopsis sp. NPDC049922]|uniref:hypothetical protein n=1 Tax=Nocardiopsis sp. NPDC049922 TaxID=3155157 RepID=UPI0033FE0727
MNEDQTNSRESSHSFQQHTARFGRATVISLGLAVIGVISIVLLLGTPSVRFPDADHPVDCRPAAEWGFLPSDNDFGGDSPGETLRDSCDRNRQTRIATAVLVAVPTAIAGSVGMTALVFRRRLSVPEADRGTEG